MSAGHIRRRGRNSWQLKFDGPRDPRIGRRNVQYVTMRGTKAEAKLKLAELIAAVGGGAYVQPTKLTVAEHVRSRVDQWEASGRISARTAERYRELVERQLVPYLGSKQIQKLGSLDIEAWHTDLLGKGRVDGKGGVSAHTVGHAHRVLSSALDEAVRHGICTKNVARVQGPPRRNDEEEILVVRQEQLGELIGRLRGHDIYPAAITALFTGLRRGELLALRWPNVDLDDAKVITVCDSLEETKTYGLRSKPPKTKAGRRVVTLPGIVVDALRDHHRKQLETRMALGLGKMPHDALVFPEPISGGYQLPRTFSERWARTAEAIGFPEVTFHALRHTHVSQLIDAGVDIVTITRRLGHSSPTVTLAFYAHLFRKDDGKASAAIDALFRAPK